MIIDFNNIEALKLAGFVGFKTIQELFIDSSQLPTIKGIYLILHLDKVPPVFLPIGTGGYFKGRNPNVLLPELKSNWVQKSLVIYIGKAGSHSNKATLRSRLKQYFNFGQGKNVGHWGGRFIWQIESSKNLVVCWKPLVDEDPRAVESRLIEKFRKQFKLRPFANLVN